MIIYAFLYVLVVSSSVVTGLRVFSEAAEVPSASGSSNSESPALMTSSDSTSLEHAREFYLPLDPLRPELQLHYRIWGRPLTTNSLTVLFVHGGPGQSIADYENNEFFDKDVFTVVEVDQRGTGKSLPSVRDVTTPATSGVTQHPADSSGPTKGVSNMRKYYLDISIEVMARDFEMLREYLNVEKWVVYGGSWGSTLGLYYATEYVDHTLALVVQGVFLHTREEMEDGNKRSVLERHPDAAQRALVLREFDVWWEKANRHAELVPATKDHSRIDKNAFSSRTKKPCLTSEAIPSDPSEESSDGEEDGSDDDSAEESSEGEEEDERPLAKRPRTSDFLGRAPTDVDPDDVRRIFRIYEKLILAGDREAAWKFYVFEWNLMAETDEERLDAEVIDPDVYPIAQSVSFFEVRLFSRGTWEHPVDLLTRVRERFGGLLECTTANDTIVPAHGVGAMSTILGRESSPSTSTRRAPRSVPTWVVQGTGDIVCPDVYAEELVRTLDEVGVLGGAYFVDGGHMEDNCQIKAALRRALADVVREWEEGRLCVEQCCK